MAESRSPYTLGWLELPSRPGTAIWSRVCMLRPLSGSCSMRARSTIVATVGLVVESSGVTSPATVICSADFATVRVESITRALAGGQDRVALPSLHAGNGHFQAILAGLQRGKHVEPGGIGCGLKLVFRLDMFQRHGGIRDHGAAGIGDRALNLADAGLGAERGANAAQAQIESRTRFNMESPPSGSGCAAARHPQINFCVKLYISWVDKSTVMIVRGIPHLDF